MIETGPRTIPKRARGMKRGMKKGIDGCTEKTYHEDMMEWVLGLSRERKSCWPFSFDMLSTVEFTMEQRQKRWSIVIGQGFQKLNDSHGPFDCDETMLFQEGKVLFPEEQRYWGGISTV